MELEFGSPFRKPPNYSVDCDTPSDPARFPPTIWSTVSFVGMFGRLSDRFGNSLLVIPVETGWWARSIPASILPWYQGDFGGRQGVLDFLYDHLADDTVRESIRKEGRQMTFEYI
jgi:hypothetical protein